MSVNTSVLQSGRDDIQVGDGFVQVIYDKPDDAGARLAMVTCGVVFFEHSLLPKDGTLHMFVNSGGKYVYRHRR